MGGFFGTNVGSYPRLLGTEGWRLAFFFVAAISCTASALVYCFALDPRRKVCLAPAHAEHGAVHASQLALPCVLYDPPAEASAQLALAQRQVPDKGQHGCGAAGPDRPPAHGRHGAQGVL